MVFASRFWFLCKEICVVALTMQNSPYIPRRLLSLRGCGSRSRALQSPKSPPLNYGHSSPSVHVVEPPLSSQNPTSADIDAALALLGIGPPPPEAVDDDKAAIDALAVASARAAEKLREEREAAEIIAKNAKSQKRAAQRRVAEIAQLETAAKQQDELKLEVERDVARRNRKRREARRDAKVRQLEEQRQLYMARVDGALNAVVNAERAIELDEVAVHAVRQRHANRILSAWAVSCTPTGEEESIEPLTSVPPSKITSEDWEWMRSLEEAGVTEAVEKYQLASPPMQYEGFSPWQ